MKKTFFFPDVDFYNLEQEGGGRGMPYNGQYCEVYKRVGTS